MPFFRKWKQIFGQKCDFLDVDAQLTGTRTKQVATHTDVIAKIKQFVKLKSLVPHGIFLHIDLQLLTGLLQMGEPGFTHQPDCHNPSSDTHVYPRIFQLLGGFLGIFGQNLRNRVREVVLAGIRLLSKRFDLFELVAAQFVDLFVEGQEFPFISVNYAPKDRAISTRLEGRRTIITNTQCLRF